MAKITEVETRDADGNVKIVRHVEGAFVHIQKPDGTIIECSDVDAKEWPWPPTDQPPEWQVFGIPMDPSKFVQILTNLRQTTITFFGDNSELILKLGSLQLGVNLSQGARQPLIGYELPLDTTPTNQP